MTTELLQQDGDMLDGSRLTIRYKQLTKPTCWRYAAEQRSFERHDGAISDGRV